ncbi:MAG: ABC transporter ATP-binding protein [Gemmatimonadota bacterium]
MDSASDRSRGDPLLYGEGLVRVYDGRQVVDVESIEVRAGEVLALLGPNGAGKSTLMRLLAALETPDSGRLLYKGREVKRDDPELRRAAVAVLQRPYLWRGTVAQNVDYGLKVRRLPASERRDRIRSVLETLDILHLQDAPVNTLSGGEAQRVALARALALMPEILFLDEPTADLDVTVRRRLLADLERIVRHAAPAIVLITHDPGEAFALADRVAVIEGGRIVQTGTPADVFEAPATEFVASFTGAEFMLDGEVAEVGEGTLVVRLDSGQSLEVAGHGASGRRVRVAYRPEDVVIGPPGSAATSARNRIAARLTRLHPQGGLVRLRLESDGLSLEALITRHALEDLDLKVGARVVAQIKATALHVFPI